MHYPMPSFNESDYQSTGNVAVDMVAECVAWHRKRNLPLKTIYLNWYYYNKFDYFVRSKMKEEAAALPQRYEFDNVIIERAAIRINKPLEVAFYA